MVTSNTRRIEQLELSIAELPASMTARAVGTLQQMLYPQIANSLEKATHQLGAEMAKIRGRSGEGRGDAG